MKAFTPLFQAVIAFVAVLTGLGLVFNLLLAPIKKDIGRLDRDITRVETKVDQILFELRKPTKNPDKQSRN